MLTPGKAHAAALHNGAKLEPIHVGPVIVREWVHSRETVSESFGHVEMGLASIHYREVVVYRLVGAAEWRTMDGRSASAKLYRARLKKGALIKPNG